MPKRLTQSCVGVPPNESALAGPGSASGFGRRLQRVFSETNRKSGNLKSTYPQSRQSQSRQPMSDHTLHSYSDKIKGTNRNNHSM